MMKSSELLVIVESVEEAVKFYTEKLAFDIAQLEVSKEHPNTLLSAHLRKGKCFITFRTPQIEELAEFSFIKRCASRCVGLWVEMKKGLDKYYQRCLKKGLKVLAEPRDADGFRTFALRDPYGNKLIFAQPLEGKQTPSTDFAGMQVTTQVIKSRKESELVNDMIEHLRGFGILRRAAKKFAKLRIKQVIKGH
jgi:catechol 2,3-dioxygenase-like lactoylglutathione lyase family enzyme